MDGSKKGDEKEGQLPIEIVRIKPGERPLPYPHLAEAPLAGPFWGGRQGTEIMKSCCILLV